MIHTDICITASHSKQTFSINVYMDATFRGRWNDYVYCCRIPTSHSKMAALGEGTDMDFVSSLEWRHNERDGVSNHQPHDCLLNRLFRHRSKKISKLCVTGLCEGNSPVTGEFPTPRAINVLSSGADLNSPGPKVSLLRLSPQVSSYPLIWAVDVDDPQAVRLLLDSHYGDVIMSTMASQITSLTIVYSTAYSRRRSKNTAKLRVTGLCAGNSQVNSPHKRPVTRKMFPFDDVIIGADPDICYEYVHESRACWLQPVCHATHPGIVTMLLDAGSERSVVVPYWHQDDPHDVCRL